MFAMLDTLGHIALNHCESMAYPGDYRVEELYQTHPMTYPLHISRELLENTPETMLRYKGLRGCTEETSDAERR